MKFSANDVLIKENGVRMNILKQIILEKLIKLEKLLSDKLNTDLGYLYQKMVAQMLYASGNKLFYYTFPKDNSTHNYEIDFLVAKKNKVCPIEVKSSGYKTHASIDAFSNKFSSKVGQKYLIYTKD